MVLLFGTTGKNTKSYKEIGFWAAAQNPISL
jgi:hypothetical protein